MKRSEVEALGIKLAPEGIQRVDRKGWTSGPLLVLVDGADLVTLVSVELRKSRGVRVGGKVIAPNASLATIASQVPGCTKGRGSGGDYLDCRGASGTLVHFYGSGNGDADISVVLDGALLR